MNCNQTQDLLGAWIDGQLEDAEQAALEAHLRECAECRTAAEGTRALHGDLLRAFQSPRAAAADVADRVIAALPREATSKPKTAFTRSPNWTTVLLGMALGFLVAVLIFPPWKTQRVAENNADAPHDTDPLTIETKPAIVRPASVARLVVSAGQGNVEYSDRPQGEWQPVTDLAQFKCPSDGALRTTDNLRCELRTTEGCVVRMNSGTEVVFQSARRVELKRGEIWCRSTENVPLEVLPSMPGVRVHRAEPETTTSPFSCTASDAACFFAAVQPGDKVQVTAAMGKVSVKAHNESLQLKQSESATITHDRIDRNPSQDRLLAASWMQPLLTSKGHTDSELLERVDELLAQIGESKLSMLYEAEIRSLGEYGVLPLLRYVESPRSGSDGERRLVAMRVISDLAPPWAIGDLVALLRDQNADVRFLSAVALQRLTSQTQGAPPEKWRSTSAELDPALVAWQTWWNQNRQRYPMRADALPLPPPTSPPQPPGGTKVRRPRQETSPTG